MFKLVKLVKLFQLVKLESFFVSFVGEEEPAVQEEQVQVKGPGQRDLEVQGQVQQEVPLCLAGGEVPSVQGGLAQVPEACHPLLCFC